MSRQNAWQFLLLTAWPELQWDTLRVEKNVTDKENPQTNTKENENRGPPYR